MRAFTLCFGSIRAIAPRIQEAARPRSEPRLFFLTRARARQRPAEGVPPPPCDRQDGGPGRAGRVANAHHLLARARARQVG